MVVGMSDSRSPNGSNGVDSDDLYSQLGLVPDEVEKITRLLGRPANYLELAMFSVMWSEHVSYKSSRIHLRRLPTEGSSVIVGPGENAGVIDAGDGLAVAVRIESHNHPSAIEPYQGAATGVGGIVRDILSVGARPIALMDPLYMGPLDNPRSRFIFEGVVSGISGYGNSVGVPTVGGELHFAPCFAGNPLVNVLCVGILRKDRLVLARASSPGSLAVLLGAATGRDGIGGVSVLASAGFGGDTGLPAEGGSSEASLESLAKRPNVQVGDPFEEKKLIEACLELVNRGLLEGLADLGGAGLTCAVSETAARSKMGIDVYLDAVPTRQADMQPFEIMISESQERMLAIVLPDKLKDVEEVCLRWQINATVIGTYTAPEAEGCSRLRVLDRLGGNVLANLPTSALIEEAPLYERPIIPPSTESRSVGSTTMEALEREAMEREAMEREAMEREAMERSRTEEGNKRDFISTNFFGCDDPGSDLLAMLADPSYVYEQYDHQLFLNTVIGPGNDGVLLRLAAPQVGSAHRGLAISTDGNPRWCSVDPRQGTAMLVAESTLNLACTGARPAAVVNCLNFGNPEHPEVMWQLSEAVDGLALACKSLGLPVVGGNVSLYNEYGGSDIEPTPVIATIGLTDRLERKPPGVQLVEGGTILILGDGDPVLGGSRWSFELRNDRRGPLPALDLHAHAVLVDLVASLVEGGLLQGVHDVSTGGIGLCAAEMVVSSGIGATLVLPEEHSGGCAALFSEAPSRVLVCTDNPVKVREMAASLSVPCEELGVAGGRSLVVKDMLELSVADIMKAWKGAIPNALHRSLEV